MKFCSHCGKERNEEDKFCNSCGAPASAGPQQKVGTSNLSNNQGQVPPTQNTYQSNASSKGFGYSNQGLPPKKSNKGLWIGLASVVGALLVGLGIWLFLQQSNGRGEKPQETTTSERRSQETTSSSTVVEKKKDELVGQWMLSNENSKIIFDIRENNEVVNINIFKDEKHPRFLERKWYYKLVDKEDGTYTIDTSIDIVRAEVRGVDTQDIGTAFAAHEKIREVFRTLKFNTPADEIKRLVKEAIKSSGTPATEAEVDKLFENLRVARDGTWEWNYQMKDLKEVLENDSSKYQDFLALYSGHRGTLTKKDETTLVIEFALGSRLEYKKVTR